MNSFITESREQTVELGMRLGGALSGGEVIALTGGLGMGKTALCEGVARALGYTGYVNSPTFNLVNIYRGRLTLYHFDMYRIPDADGVEDTGFYDYLDDKQGVLFIEWSENIADILPQDAIKINIVRLSDNRRRFEVEGLNC
jgi:hydrolase, P-loop family